MARRSRDLSNDRMLIDTRRCQQCRWSCASDARPNPNVEYPFQSSLVHENCKLPLAIAVCFVDAAVTYSSDYGDVALIYFADGETREAPLIRKSATIHVNRFRYRDSNANRRQDE